MAPQLRREDLVVPYIHVPPAAPSAATGVVSQSMPMAAMFMKNKLLSWLSLLTALLAYVGELHGEPLAEGAQSGYLRVALGVLGIAVCYMELFLPGSSGAIKRQAVDEVVEGISSTVATAIATATSA